MAEHNEASSLSIAEEITPIQFTSPLDLGVADTQEVPSTITGFQKYRFHSSQPQSGPAGFIGFITQRLVRTRKELEVEFPGVQQAVFNVILAIDKLVRLEKFSHSDEKSLNIRYILETIMGENDRAKGPYSFPAPLQFDAANVLEAVNKRLPAIEEITSGIAPPAAPGPSNSSTSTPRVRAHKKRRTNDPQRPLPSISAQTVSNVLRGIVDAGTMGRRSYRLADKTTARDCNVVGDNGIAVGTWWPYRICALRDGAHGATMAGIAGSIKDGAYSIVVSGK